MIYHRLLSKLGLLVLFTISNVTEFLVGFLALFNYCSVSSYHFTALIGFKCKFSQECPVNAGVPQGFILCPALLRVNINNFPDDVTCYIAICVDNTTHYSNCDQASNF